MAEFSTIRLDIEFVGGGSEVLDAIFTVDNVPDSDPEDPDSGRPIFSGHSFPLNRQVIGDIDIERSFPNLSFTDPVFLTHSPDGSDRIFVVEQCGEIQVFPND